MAGFTIIDVSNPLVPIYIGHIEGAGAPNYLDGAWGLYLLSTPPLPPPPVSRLATVQTLPVSSTPGIVKQYPGRDY
jgi:hypothetical protein